jgi:hypothetical protein
VTDAQEVVARPRTVDGYRLVVPQEWQKIPVQRGTDKAIKELLDKAFAKHGRDEVAQYRRELEARLKKAVRQARTNAGVDMFLPFGNRERNLPASFLISYVEFGSVNAPPKEAVLTEVSSSLAGAVPVTLDGTAGVRTQRVYPAEPERDVPYPSTRIEYLLPVPGTADSWLSAAFSTVGGNGPDDVLAKLLCGLFHAIMSTFRWHYKEETS